MFQIQLTGEPTCSKTLSSSRVRTADFYYMCRFRKFFCNCHEKESGGLCVVMFAPQPSSGLNDHPQRWIENL